MKSDTGPFTLTPEWVLDADLSDRAIRLYGVLGRYADAEGECWPSRTTLAQRLRCSLDSIDRAKKELLDVGALVWHQQSDSSGSLTSNRYTLIRAAPQRLAPPKSAATPSRKVAAENENHLEREPIGDPAAEAAPEPEPKVNELVAGFVDDYRTICGGHEPPRSWRAACGKQVKYALKDGESPEDIAICLGIAAKEGKHPGNLEYILSDMHANRPRRVQR